MATYYVDGAVGNDGNAGTAAGAGNAWATIQKAANTVAAGDKVNVKASATYNEMVDLVTSGTAASRIVWEGYTTTVGDGGLVTIDGANTRAACLRLKGREYNTFLYVIFTGATASVLQQNGTTAGGHIFESCRFSKGSAGSSTRFHLPESGTYGSIIRTLFSRCEITGFGLGSDYLYDNVFFANVIHHAAGIAGMSYAAPNRWIKNLIHDISDNGIYVNGVAERALVLENTVYNCTGDGLRLYAGADNNLAFVSRNIFASNGGYGVNVQNAPSGHTEVVLDKNAFYGNTSGEVNDTSRVIVVSAGVTLSGSPFTDVSGSNRDLSLNTTAGAGAACRAAGLPGSFNTSGTAVTGYPDIGAVQHADPAGGGGGTVFTGGHIYIGAGMGR